MNSGIPYFTSAQQSNMAVASYSRMNLSQRGVPATSHVALSSPVALTLAATSQTAQAPNESFDHRMSRREAQEAKRAHLEKCGLSMHRGKLGRAELQRVELAASEPSQNFTPRSRSHGNSPEGAVSMPTSPEVKQFVSAAPSSWSVVDFQWDPILRMLPIGSFIETDLVNAVNLVTDGPMECIWDRGDLWKALMGEEGSWNEDDDKAELTFLIFHSADMLIKSDQPCPSEVEGVRALTAVFCKNGYSCAYARTGSRTEFYCFEAQEKAPLIAAAKATLKAARRSTQAVFAAGAVSIHTLREARAAVRFDEERDRAKRAIAYAFLRSQKVL